MIIEFVTLDIRLLPLVRARFAMCHPVWTTRILEPWPVIIDTMSNGET
jgi:hypothetical protein